MEPEFKVGDTVHIQGTEFLIVAVGTEDNTGRYIVEWPDGTPSWAEEREFEEAA